jgi:hypothetical protein
MVPHHRGATACRSAIRWRSRPAARARRWAGDAQASECVFGVGDEAFTGSAKPMTLVVERLLNPWSADEEREYLGDAG